MKSDLETGKTTVLFPINLLWALRAYMLRERLSPHKQSGIIAEALEEYLKGKGIKIPPENGFFEYSVELIPPKVP